ncbi:D-glycerate dehydrogenase [Kineosporia sp. J2-2]|uniref:D-glycerate dehydrogenase n=1 Tax=Kineosporia corallincola TaxID=2835133 RepID=A0ABS5TRU7_9ACTN|nr:D-glycerate dehydrogenase [Kineosporia corallincola]MBT0773518.1 D-glycerate dehydrogenase [Kineosporia corallincola]
MSQPTVFVSAPVPDDLLEELAREFDVVAVPPGTTQDLGRYGSPVGWLMGGGTPIDAGVLAQLPDLKVVSNSGVGYDSLVMDDIRAAGVIAANTPGVLDNAVAEIALGLVLSLGRGIVGFDRFTRDGRWADGAAPLTRDVHGKTVGVLGMGRIGKRVAQLLQPLGVSVIYHNRARRPEIDESGLAQWREREAFFAESDFVVVLVPLSPQTRGYVGAADLARMQPTAYLINLARGAVVDTPALVEAIRSGQIAGAGLDVFDVEPLPLDDELQTLPNVILLPHIGSATAETRRAMSELAVRNLRNGSLGQPVETPIP